MACNISVAGDAEAMNETNSERAFLIACRKVISCLLLIGKGGCLVRQGVSFFLPVRREGHPHSVLCMSHRICLLMYGEYETSL